MKEVLDFLRDCGTFYLATEEDGKPHVRPFGAVCEFGGKLYIITSNRKLVYKQMLQNPHIEICGMLNDTWIRVECETVRDDTREAKIKMLDENESLKQLYSADDGIMEVMYLKNAEAVISSFTAEPKVIRF